jgi:GT2 family glycosyltransferase
MTVSIIIVSYNTSQLLIDCLKSVFASLGKMQQAEYEVIVVDNASRDNSVSMVRQLFPRVRLIGNTSNKGFTQANNQGIKAAKGDFLLLLNSDTRITPDTIPCLLSQIKRDNKTGVVGCQIRNKDNSLQPSCGYFPNFGKVLAWMLFIDDIPYLQTIIRPYHVEHRAFYMSEHEVDWVTGACFFFRKEIVRRVGCFDEEIFMYGEEVEWCFRIKKAGYRIIYTPKTYIYHLKGGSSDGINAGISQEFTSLQYFYRKHKSILLQTFLPLVLKFGALLRFVLFGIILHNPKKAKLYAQTITMAG